jgi:SET domain-containing protein
MAQYRKDGNKVWSCYSYLPTVADLDTQNFYMMHLRRGLHIDATHKGSLARFVNHSCKPNCKPVPWVVGQELKLGFFVGDEAIESGTEITISYGFDKSDDRCFCCCGAEGCKGFMGGNTSTEDVS